MADKLYNPAKVRVERPRAQRFPFVASIQVLREVENASRNKVYRRRLDRSSWWGGDAILPDDPFGRIGQAMATKAKQATQ